MSSYEPIITLAFAAAVSLGCLLWWRRKLGDEEYHSFRATDRPRSIVAAAAVAIAAVAIVALVVERLF